jgi:hypothetical protein
MIDEGVIARSWDGISTLLSRGCGFTTVCWNKLDDALFTQILLKSTHMNSRTMKSGMMFSQQSYPGNQSVVEIFKSNLCNKKHKN